MIFAKRPWILNVQNMTISTGNFHSESISFPKLLSLSCFCIEMDREYIG